MTEEEEFEFRLRYEQEQAAQAAPPEEQGQSTMDAIRGGLESLNQGSALGFGDEIAAAGRTGLDMLTRGWGDEGNQSLGDTYRMYRDDQRGVREQFAEENPGSALALSVAGGLGNPLNKIKAGLTIAKGAGAGNAAMQAGARGAIEGAIGGAGAADEMSDVVDAAKSGAQLGGALGGGLGGLGRALSSRKVAQELGKGEDFVPFNMLENTGGIQDTVSSGYRNVLGRVPGAAGRLKKQQANVIGKAQQQADDVAEDVFVNKEAIKRVEAQRAVDKAATLKKTLQKIDDDLAAAQRKMRGEQGSRAIPDYGDDASKALKAQIAAEPDPYKQNQILRTFYGKDGPAFQSVKSQKFEVDQKLANMLKKQFPDGMDGIDDIDDLVGEVIDGNALMAWRNNPAQIANKATGSTYGSFRKEVGEYDAQIERLLNNKGIGTKQFRADKKAYPAYKAFDEAVSKAEDASGVFTGKQLAKTGRKSNRAINVEEGQVLGSPMRQAELAAAQAKKAAKPGPDPMRKLVVDDKNHVLNQALKESKRKLSGIKAKSVAENVTVPSMMATTAAAAGGFYNPLAMAAAAAGGNILATQAGQRALAGQTGLQTLLQDDETAKLLAALIRQTAVRQSTGE